MNRLRGFLEVGLGLLACVLSSPGAVIDTSVQKKAFDCGEEILDWACGEDNENEKNHETGRHSVDLVFLFDALLFSLSSEASLQSSLEALREFARLPRVQSVLDARYSALVFGKYCPGSRNPWNMALRVAPSSTHGGTPAEEEGNHIEACTLQVGTVGTAVDIEVLLERLEAAGRNNTEQQESGGAVIWVENVENVPLSKFLTPSPGAEHFTHIEKEMLALENAGLAIGALAVATSEPKVASFPLVSLRPISFVDREFVLFMGEHENSELQRCSNSKGNDCTRPMASHESKSSKSGEEEASRSFFKQAWHAFAADQATAVLQSLDYSKSLALAEVTSALAGQCQTDSPPEAIGVWKERARHRRGVGLSMFVSSSVGNTVDFSFRDLSNFNAVQTRDKLEEMSQFIPNSPFNWTPLHELQHSCLKAGHRARILPLSSFLVVEKGEEHQPQRRNVIENGIYDQDYASHMMHAKELYCDRCTVASSRAPGALHTVVQCVAESTCISQVGCVDTALSVQSNRVVGADIIDAETAAAASYFKFSALAATHTYEAVNRTEDNCHAAIEIAPLGKSSGFRNESRGLRNVEEVEWRTLGRDSQARMEEFHRVFERDEPLIVRGVLHALFPSLSYADPTTIKHHFTTKLRNVKMVEQWGEREGDTHMSVLDADNTQPLLRMAGKVFCPRYQVQNVSRDEMFRLMMEAPPDAPDKEAKRAYYYFGKVPSSLKPEVMPDRSLYDNLYDWSRKQQYLWLSSAGPEMHTHFDQDKNMFLQVYGEKEFRMFPPESNRRMSLFPRTHPLWHKSQVDMHNPSPSFPDSLHVEGKIATVRAGDLLFVPPYYFHHVTSVSGSVSLSTWSRHNGAFDAMSSAYGRGCAAQKLKSLKARAWGLQFYIEKLSQLAYGPNSVDSFALTLLASRFRSKSIRTLFSPIEASSLLQSVCGTPSSSSRDHPPIVGDASARAKPIHVAWMSSQVRRELAFDAEIAWNSFRRLQNNPPVLDLLLSEFVEQLVCDSLGCSRMHAFLQHCVRSGVVYKVDESLDAPPSTQSDSQQGIAAASGEEEEEDMNAFDPSVWDMYKPGTTAPSEDSPPPPARKLESTRCEICHQSIHSDAEAQEHFKATGHLNFERHDPSLELDD